MIEWLQKEVILEKNVNATILRIFEHLLRALRPIIIVKTGEKNTILCGVIEILPDVFQYGLAVLSSYIDQPIVGNTIHTRKRLFE
ncbi:MAG: hypothetical protein IPJ67_02235 [Candidatus Moraniibacteriota bacterium]|nr:MAG: hypothetical protein IPJ67_02235 [Candidatus Moranbacteria bacterium]